MPRKASTSPIQPQPLNDHDFAATYRKYRDKVRRFIWLMTTDNNLSADLTQDTFITVYHNLHRHDPAKGNLQSWLSRIARNTVISYFRKPDYRSTKPIGKQWSTDEEAASQINARAYCFQPEILSEGVNLRALVAGLKPIYRQPLELFYLGGLSCQEIAQDLKWPIGSVLNRLHWGRRYLRQRLTGKELETAAEL